MTVLLTIVGWLVIPVVGYFVILFLGRPLSRFYDLRTEIGETLAEYDNVSPNETERMIAAQTLFRRLGTKMLTLADHHRLADWTFKHRVASRTRTDLVANLRRHSGRQLPRRVCQPTSLAHTEEQISVSGYESERRLLLLLIFLPLRRVVGLRQNAVHHLATTLGHQESRIIRPQQTLHQPSRITRRVAEDEEVTLDVRVRK